MENIIPSGGLGFQPILEVYGGDQPWTEFDRLHDTCLLAG